MCAIGDFIYFTDEQKEHANAVPIADILRMEGEEFEKSGSEWRWKRHRSVTFRDNCWYRHSEEIGSYAIDFMQEFYGLSFQEAVTYLLRGDTNQDIKYLKPHVKVRDDNLKSVKAKTEKKELEKKEFILPEKNEHMKRVYAYLIKKRFIDKEMIAYFACEGLLYESRENHNAVFVGKDKEGVARHAHQKGTYSEGNKFQIDEEGSDPSYGFGHVGESRYLYVFEAPIDLLSFITLYPKDWKQNSYIALNGIAQHALLKKLEDYPHIDTVVLCLDHDRAGIENNGRLAEILLNNCKGISIKVLQPEYKDWNEDLKGKNGVIPAPAEEHPKIQECFVWGNVLKTVTESIDIKYATKEYLGKYYRGIYEDLQAGEGKKYLEEAFDGNGLLLSGIAIKCIENCGRELGKDVSSEQIIDNLCKRYYPHKDKGRMKTRVQNLQKAYEEVMEVYDTKDLSQKINKELLVKKCMNLTMECVKAHVFITVPECEKLKVKESKVEGGLMLTCSQ